MLRHKVLRNDAIPTGVWVNAVWHGRRIDFAEQLQAIQVVNIWVGLRSHLDQLGQNFTDAAQSELADPGVAAELLTANLAVSAKLRRAGIVLVG